MYTLKNGNKPFDLRTSVQCGAKTRTGEPCRAPAMRNKYGKYTRCRKHGGASTGPKTTQGREKCSKARIKHGRYSKQAKEKNNLSNLNLGMEKLMKQQKEVMGKLNKDIGGKGMIGTKVYFTWKGERFIGIIVDKVRFVDNEEKYVIKRLPDTRVFVVVPYDIERIIED